MKRIFVLVMVLGLMVVNAVWAGEPVAVVELFASEGCSSCPPADELLIRLLKESNASQRIYALNFAVDYWDYLGWKDPFSRPEFTQRQYRYKDFLGSSSAYTPQMVVNGQVGFVGSNEAKARKHIQDFLNIPSALSIQLTRVGKSKIKYQLSSLPKGAVLNLALVQRQVKSRVTSGENAGRTITHANMVLEFKTIELDSDYGEVEFNQNLMDSTLKENSVIAFVQNNQDMKILGAQEVRM